jgi:hypothetical protein
MLARLLVREAAKENTKNTTPFLQKRWESDSDEHGRGPFANGTSHQLATIRRTIHTHREGNIYIERERKIDVMPQASSDEDMHR